MVTSAPYIIVRTIALAALFSMLGYALLTFMPGDPLDRMLEDNPDFTFEDYMRLRAVYGLDDPVAVRYFKWVGQNVQGQLGYSRQYKIPVANLVLPRLQNTLIVVFLTLVFGLAGALVLGVLNSLLRHWLIAVPVRTLAWLGSSLPAFWLGLTMIILFSINLHVLPPGGIMSSDVQPGALNAFIDRLKYLVMPVLVLSLTQVAAWMRYALNNLPGSQQGEATSGSSTDFLRLMGEWSLLLVSSIGTRFAALLAGVVVVETVFSYPGVGKLLFDSVMGNDFVVSVAILMILINLGLAGGLLGALAYGVVVRMRRGAAYEDSDRRAVAGDLGGPIPSALRRAAAVGALGGLGLIGVFCYVGPFTSPFQPDQVNLRERFARPSFFMASAPGQPPGHPLGTDDLGRDTMTRAMFGGRTSLGTALVVAFFAVVLAAIISALAGLSQGFWDFIADPIGSFLAALPDVAILMIFSKVVGGLPMAVLILVVLGRLYGERVIRFATLAMRDDSDSMQRAGIGEIIPALGVVAALCAGSTVAIETAVSYLGLGVQPPTPSWGNMLSNAQQYFFSAPWLVFYPGMFILLTVLCCYVVADDLRHATAPGWR